MVTQQSQTTKIELLDKLLYTINQTATLLLAAEGEENMAASILQGMELIGSSVDVDRVQIWQNEVSGGSLYFVHKYEWLSDTGRQKKIIPIGTKLTYNSIPEWIKKLLRGTYINCTSSELSGEEKNLLFPYEVNAILIIPLFLRDRFWGLFCFQDCCKERIFAAEEINILRSCGLMIANAFLRNDMIQNIRSGSAQLKAALKESREANTAKSKFLANMSHEIRTPMNVILGVTESQLLDETHPSKIKDAFEKIFDSGNLLLRIINDILDLSKIESGKFELNPVKYKSLSMINDSVTMNVMQFGHKKINFILHVDESVPVNLLGDELRIKQILNNLLSNAFKYTNAGEIRLSITAENTDESKTTLNICVNDTGSGMTEEQVSKLFDEYTRFYSEANRTTIGTGLGMAITRNLVTMMEGCISVNSVPGEGTSFTVQIPQEIASPGLLGKDAVENLNKYIFTSTAKLDGTAREKLAHIVREAMPYGKVLVVDDMKSNIDVAKLLLDPYQLEIDSAESGFEAIDLIKSGRVYDIIFMDHMMPKMDGIETVIKLRKMGYNRSIIALTADAIAGQKELFLANGFDGFISKPIDIRQLNSSLNKFIRDKQAPEVLEALLNNKKDMELKETEQDDASSDDSELSFQEIAIPGIDAAAGLALYNGEFDLFLSALRSYVPNAISVIEKMRIITQESLTDYVINVHGLKSISSNIGAEKLRKEAMYLESKAKSGDLDEILKRNDALLRDAEDLTSNIQGWLANLDKQNPKPFLERPDMLLLTQLQKSCEAYDMDGIDQAMDKLESAYYTNDASLIIWLREKITELDFSSVTERLTTYLADYKE